MADLAFVKWLKENSAKNFVVNPLMYIALVIIGVLLIWALWKNLSPYL